MPRGRPRKPAAEAESEPDRLARLARQAEAEAAAAEALEARTLRAEAAWGPGDVPTRHRAAMLIAADQLDGQELWNRPMHVIEWLRFARPEFMHHVANHVAAYCVQDWPWVWDALMCFDTADPIEAGELQEVVEGDGWTLDPAWLVD